MALLDPNAPLAISITLNQLEAMLRRIVKDEMASKPADEWLSEGEVLALCKKSRRTLTRAIQSNKIDIKYVKANPLGRGLLIHRKAISYLLIRA